jgi:hypothetical protein
MCVSKSSETYHASHEDLALSLIERVQTSRYLSSTAKEHDSLIQYSNPTEQLGEKPTSHPEDGQWRLHLR